MISVAIATLGCKTNACESATIIGQFTPEDCRVVPFEEAADIYIINTCTVTNRTDFKSRNLIRKALERKAADPAVKIVVTGCYAQRSAEEVRGMGDIDLIVDNQNKLDVASLLTNEDYRFLDIMVAEEFAFRPVQRMVEHSRAFQKIQDGCDFYCSYCAVPHARGHNRSAKFADVLAQARLFVASGYKEIVLGGVNLGLYRDGEHGLAEVVEALEQIDGLELIRLSSLEPQLISASLLDIISGCSKLCHHLHIALQSGCDSVLQRMQRHYQTADISALVEDLLQRLPDLALGFDVITGFPGETEEEFEATYRFLDSLPFTYLHVFSYSQRKETPAATLPGQIHGQVKTQRTKRLSSLSDAHKQSYLQRLIRDRVALRGVCEAHTKGYSTFLSDHYIRGYSRGEQKLGEVLSIQPSEPIFDGLSGS